MSKRATFLALALAAVMSLGLFMISYQVQDLEDQLDSLNRDIARDSRAVHVLRAEWAHLNDPQRLRMLSERYLGLAPIATRQLGKAEDIPWRPLVAASERAGDPAPEEAPASAVSGGDKPLEDALPAIRRALGLTPVPVKEVRQ